MVFGPTQRVTTAERKESKQIPLKLPGKGTGRKQYDLGSHDVRPASGSAPPCRRKSSRTRSRCADGVSDVDGDIFCAKRGKEVNVEHASRGPRHEIGLEA